ncbi:YdbH family protein [Erwinia tracheiphila]|uniref:Uncharacterized protein n=1 Tax=Erwinia tracheiphila TaxID=65700 RepID=A0A0M2K589_9GAMM|nr:YdbH family protein [Erwinia tracheiphila]EOS93370.1 hypothetical protein ETR_19423 [Erwinia tracheiphila PSU-1]KKF34545.1 hypothetical protein SY86_02235 [Erwinia tracheiphila]UIA86217.1 YdbH family protein [Erwinia tracheiphila]UIA98433.1 YdbH family protein [Erwinia tracheiphila]
MTRSWKLFITTIALLLFTSVTLLLTMTHWLPRLAGVWLPVNTTVRLDNNLTWNNGGLWLPVIRYRAGECQLAAVRGLSLKREKGRWKLAAEKVQVDSACFHNLTAGYPDTTLKTLAEWQAMLPATDVTLAQLTILPWQEWAGVLHLGLDNQQQQICYQGKNLNLIASLRKRQLNITSLSFNVPGLPQPLHFSGELTLPVTLNAIPEAGTLHTTLTTDVIPHALNASLRWQKGHGEFNVARQDEDLPLLRLPWQVTPTEIAIEQGEWYMPYGNQRLSGAVSLSLKNWQQGLAATEINGRINMLTEGKGGKGNVVMALGPGHLDWRNSALPFRLTGDSKIAQLIFFAAVPGEIRGALSDPVLALKPGALLRMRGQLLSTIEVNEARWPLSGVMVSSQGINGRLQAILSAHQPDKGQFRLHLDGRASNFWPDKGQWQWRYWGEGELASLKARCDVRGRGRWQDKLIELQSLSTGFDQIAYGSMTVHAPLLLLETPLRWKRDPLAPSFNGILKLNAKKILFSSGGYLPPATLLMKFEGRDPDAFLLKGFLEAHPVGPVQLQGRWDGQRLRGQAWWPEQPLTVFQSLLSDDLKLKILGGSLKAQVAFSAASTQGFEAGGHWVVANGSARTPDNQITGTDFSLPFRFKAHQWYFGQKGPVSLRIKEVKNQFILRNITADLQGWYPWNTGQPLHLSNVGIDLLGGTMRMENLSMPQTQAATLCIKGISMSELITAIQPKQIAISGHINAVLPLWLDNARWLVKGGWITNSGLLTVRLDKNFADTIADNNIAAGAAIDWLRYMEISRSWATVDIDNLGQMTMKAQVNGTSRFSDKNQRVSLNYTQQENLFQLWRSLRFGDNLQSWLEQNTSLPTHKENLNETH